MSIHIQKTEGLSTRFSGALISASFGKDRKRILSRLDAETKQIASRVHTAALRVLLMLTKIVFLFGSPEHPPATFQRVTRWSRRPSAASTTSFFRCQKHDLAKWESCWIMYVMTV